MSSNPRPQEVQDVVAAFKKSIIKWENVVLSAEDGRGIADCGLCELFWYSINTCIGCPVMEATGKRYCNGSPYAEYEAAMHRVDDIEACYIPESEGPTLRAEAAAHAKDELAYLKNLLKKWEETHGL